MATFEVQMDGEADYLMVVRFTSSGRTVTMDLGWRRPGSNGYTSQDGSADYILTIDGTTYTGTYRFYAGAGGAIATQWIRSVSKTVSQKRTMAFRARFSTATSAAGTADWSSSVLLVPNAPSVASPYGADTPTSDSMRFRCSGQGGGSVEAGVDYWEFRYAKNSAFTSDVSSWIRSGGTSTVEGLSRDTLYYFQARGVNDFGDGDLSATDSARTLHTRPDAPPAPVVTPDSTTVAYTAGNPGYVGAGVTSREVQVSADATFATVLQTKTAAADTFTGLSRAKTYYIRQRVQNAVGWSDYGATTTVGTTYDPPSAPTGYAAYDIASTSARVNGGSVADNGGRAPSNQRVQYNTTASDVGALLVTSGYWNGADLTGLTEDTTYYFRVAAYNSGTGGGWGAYGDWKSFKTRVDVPHAPTGVAVSAITDFTALVSWALPADLNGSELQSIKLRISTSPSLAANQENYTLGPTVTNQAVSGLLKNTKYYAQVWSTSNKGLGSASPIISFTTTGTGTGPQPVWMKISGVWRQVLPWIKVAGVWRPATPWMKINGTWRSN